MVSFSGMMVMEVVREEHPSIERFPATSSGFLRLSPRGLWDGIGVYESPVIDLGEIFTFSGIVWDSIEEFSTTIDKAPGLPKTIEVRYHDYAPPVMNVAGLNWSDGEIPSAQDPGWGSGGSLLWLDYENNVLQSGVDVRYIQWRATLRGA